MFDNEFELNKKDGYRKQNVRQRQKSRGLKNCSIEAFYPYAKLMFGRPLHASILCLHERQEIIITKGGCLPTHLHKCYQNIRSYIRFTYLFTRWSLCRPKKVEFSGQAEKWVSNKLYLQRYAHFGFPWLYAPGTIAVNITWIEREFDACQTARSMYPSIFNRFPVIQPLSLKVSHFNTNFHIWPPQGTPLGQSRYKCNMDGKRIQCL